MRLRDAIEQWQAKFDAAGIESARLDARLLALHVTKREFAELIADPDLNMDDGEADELAMLCEQRLTFKPIAHLLGVKEFWSLPFAINETTLVPRPDSETIIEAALECVTDRSQTCRVLDLGTGSGCLLLALLSELPNAHGVGVDASKGALQIAVENARAFGMDERALFVEGNWGAPVSGHFDLIVCNPPYIPDTDRAALAPEVRDFEPASALFGGIDGLNPLREIAPTLKRLLSPKGFYIMEFGQGQSAAVSSIVSASGLEIVQIRKDLAGIERVIVAKAA